MSAKRTAGGGSFLAAPQPTEYWRDFSQLANCDYVTAA